MGYGRHKIKSAVSFGLGLLVATILPPQCVIIAASIALVIVSVCCARR